MKIKYFGTNLTVAGHYLWDVLKGNVYNRSLELKDLEFNPEHFFKSSETFRLTKYAVFGSTTVFGICGSPIDKRNGCKSIFIIDGVYTEKQIKAILLNNEFFNKIIEVMQVTISLD